MAKSHAEVMAAIKASEGDLMTFHEICTSLHMRTQQCLNRAERAERPNSALSFRWEELIEQLQTDPNIAENMDDLPIQALSIATLAERIASDPAITPTAVQPNPMHSREWEIGRDDDYDEQATRLYDTTPSQSGSQATFDLETERSRPGSSGVLNSLRDSLRRAQN